MRLEHTIGQAAFIFLHDFQVERILDQEACHFLLRKRNWVFSQAVSLAQVLIEQGKSILVEVVYF